VEDGIPYTSFGVGDCQAEYGRLRALGVEFTQEPTQMGPVTTAVFDDTCGNLIQIAQRT
jgi:predicted enzyme related to lactoylglutathione lyase